MKRWHIEEIMYLNDLDKRKITLPAGQHFFRQTGTSDNTRKDPFLLVFARKIVALALKNL